MPPFIAWGNDHAPRPFLQFSPKNYVAAGAPQASNPKDEIMLPSGFQKTGEENTK